MSIRPRFRSDTQPMSWKLTKTDASTGVTTPEDLTGATVHFTYNKKTGVEVKLAANLIDAPNGLIRFDIGATTFDEAGKFVFDIQVLYSSGVVTTFIKDTIDIQDDVNKS